MEFLLAGSVLRKQLFMLGPYKMEPFKTGFFHLAAFKCPPCVSSLIAHFFLVPNHIPSSGSTSLFIHSLTEG